MQLTEILCLLLLGEVGSLRPCAAVFALWFVIEIANVCPERLGLPMPSEVPEGVVVVGCWWCCAGWWLGVCVVGF